MRLIEQVSVVIPAYKAEKLICRTIKSLIDARIPAGNIYVVEDGVFDNTESVVKSFSGVNFISCKKNKGAPYVRNLGLSLVLTEYVMFIDSDDFVSEKLVVGMVERAILSKADLVFGPWRFDGEKIKQGKLRQPPELKNADWVFYWINSSCVPTCSVLWRTEKVRAIGAWDERLKKNQDGELAVRGFISGLKVATSNLGYSTYWQHSSHRVSNASNIDRAFSSEIVYKMIESWLDKEKLARKLSFELGKYCRRNAWIHADNYELHSMWSNRAISLGYKSKGYSKLTNILYYIFYSPKFINSLKQGWYKIMGEQRKWR